MSYKKSWDYAVQSLAHENKQYMCFTEFDQIAWDVLGHYNLPQNNWTHLTILLGIKTAKIMIMLKTSIIPAKRRRGHSLTACNTSPPTLSKMADRVRK